MQSTIFCKVYQEHANACLERRGVIGINSDSHSESEQHNSDNHQTSSNKENEPIIQETLDALTRKIQAAIGSCKMEKENVLQLNIQRGYCFQDFTKAFRKNWNFKKNNNRTWFHLLEEQEQIMVAYLVSFTQVCLNLVY